MTIPTRSHRHGVASALAVVVVAVLGGGCGGHAESGAAASEEPADAVSVQLCLDDPRLSVEYSDFREEGRGEALEIWQGKWFVANLIFASSGEQAEEWTHLLDDKQPERVRNVLIEWPHLVPKHGLDRVLECLRVRAVEDG